MHIEEKRTKDCLTPARAAEPWHPGARAENPIRSGVSKSRLPLIAISPGLNSKSFANHSLYHSLSSRGAKHKMMSSLDGRTAKFRVSCDGCNESKVRCSQTKPQCRRCARQGIACVYGLSRRSHRTAPRVGASQTQTALEGESFPSGDVTSSPQALHRSSNLTGGGPNSSSSAARDLAVQGQAGSGGTTAVISEVTAALQEDAATATDRALEVSSTDLVPNPDLYASHYSDYGSLDLPTSFESAFSSLNDPSTSTSNLPGRFFPLSSSSGNNGIGSSGDSIFGSEICDEPQRPASGPCDCHNTVVKQLLSLPFQSEKANGALDTQFAQLKHAISVSEECISCACTLRDEMSISTK